MNQWCRSSLLGSTEAVAAMASEADKDKDKLVITNEDRKQRLEQFSAQFADTCVKFQIPEEPSAQLFGIMDSFAAEQEMGFEPSNSC